MQTYTKNNARTKVICNARNTPVFKTVDFRIHTTMNDVEDMLLASRKMSHKHKVDLFQSCDLDYTMVCKYYDTVAYLNSCFGVKRRYMFNDFMHDTSDMSL